MGAGKRLKRAVDAWDGTTKSLSEVLKDAGVRGGTSYGMLRLYFEDDPEPPLDVLRVLAPVLGVSVRWLAFGDGPMSDTDAEREAAELIASTASADTFRTMGELGGDWAPMHLFRHTLNKFVGSLPDAPAGDELQRLVKLLEDAVMAPARMVAPKQPGKPMPIADPDRWRGYTLSVLAALEYAMRPAGDNVTAQQLLEGHDA
jgi:hypothetical protein